MSTELDDEIKRWTAKRKSALVLEIFQGKQSISEASRLHDVTPAEIESWVDQAKAGMENALRAKPKDVQELYESQLKDLQEAYGEAMLELRARNCGRPCWERRKTSDPSTPTGLKRGRGAYPAGQTLPVVRGP